MDAELFVARADNSNYRNWKRRLSRLSSKPSSANFRPHHQPTAADNHIHKMANAYMPSKSIQGQTMTKRLMRTDVGRFAMCPLWILQSGISDRAIRLFALLAAQYADRDEVAYPSRGRLARDLQCSTSSIDRALKHLTAICAITVERRFTPGGEPTSNKLSLHFSRPQGLFNGEVSPCVRPPICTDDERTIDSYPDKNLQTSTAQSAGSRPMTSVWKRGLAIAHSVIEDFPDEEHNWPHELASRMLNQGIEANDRGPNGDKPKLFARVLEACIVQRKLRKGDGGIHAWRHRQRDRRDRNRLQPPR